MKTRIRFVFLLLAIGFLLLAFRVIWLHLFFKIPDRYAALRSNVERGSIIDSEGFPLAVSQEVTSIGINPARLRDKKALEKLLTDIGHLSQGEIQEVLHSDRFRWLFRKAPRAILERFKKSGIRDITYIKEYKRIYPDATLFSHLIGFVNLDNVGREGVEATFHNYLSGEYIPLSDSPFVGQHFHNALQGYTLRLTLNRMAQYTLDKEIRKVFEDRKAKSAFGIIMETESGRILGLVNYPNFDPNSVDASEHAERRNRSISDTFEPGSTFKMFISAALLEAGVVSEADPFYCPGHIEAHGHRIECTGTHGKLNFSQVLQKSCNIGIIKATQKIKAAQLYQTLSHFGFGEKTGIELTGEQSGILRDSRQWSALSMYSMAMGYEISVTGIQLIQAAAAIANGGYLVRPQIVESVETPDSQKVHRSLMISRKKIISNHTSQRLLHILHLATQANGTGYLATPVGIKVAGKTGTAKKSLPGKGYASNKHIASFLGFFPYEKPKYAVLIMVDEPAGEYYGGSIAAPVFRKIVDQLRHHLHLSPSLSYEQLKKQRYHFTEPKADLDEQGVPKFTAHSLRDALWFARSYEVPVTFSGSGKVQQQKKVDSADSNHPVWELLLQ